MHIVVIADPIENQTAGVFRYTDGMIRALADFLPDAKITAIMQHRHFDHPRVETLQVPRLIPIKNDPFRKWFRIPRAINRLRPDVVIEPAHFGPLRLNPSIRRVTVIHDLVPILYPCFSDTLSSILQRIFLPGILRKTNMIVANSGFTQKSIEQRYPFAKGKTVAVYPGIGQEQNAVSWDDNYVSGIAPGHYLLHVGTLEPRKNIPMLLDGFARVKKKTGDASLKLVLAGKPGWKNRGLTRTLKNHPYHDSIVLTGFIPDRTLTMLYQHALGLVMPSLYEGFGFPMAEAMMARCPVLASDREVFHEITGGHALYADPEDSDAWTSAMLKLITRDFQPLVIENAYLHALQYSWESYARRLSEIFTH